MDNYDLFASSSGSAARPPLLDASRILVVGGMRFDENTTRVYHAAARPRPDNPLCVPSDVRRTGKASDRPQVRPLTLTTGWIPKTGGQCAKNLSHSCKMITHSIPYLNPLLGPLTLEFDRTTLPFLKKSTGDIRHLKFNREF